MRSQSAHAKAQAPPFRLVNIRVPEQIWDAVDRMTKQLRASKNDVVVALLEAGLRLAEKKIR